MSPGHPNAGRVRRPGRGEATGGGRPTARCERAADAVVHAAGLAFGLAGCLALAAAAAPHADARRVAALAPYAAGLLAMLACSALYNLAPDGAPRQALLLSHCT